MIIHYYNTAAILTLISILFSGCAIVPNRNTLTLNKTIELDERAIEKLNEDLKLNVDLGIDIQYGQRYSDVH